MSTTTAKDAEGMSYIELKALLESKKTAEIDKVTKELTAAEGIVASLKAQLVNLGALKPESDDETPAPKRRGRKPNAMSNGNGAAHKSPAKKGKRGEVGESIRAFIGKAGKKGVHVSEVAKSLNMKPTNVSAFIYGPKTGVHFKKVSRGTFALK